MKKFSRTALGFLILILVIIPFFGFARTTKQSRLNIKAQNRLRNMEQVMPGWSHVGRIRFDSVSVHSESALAQVFFTTPLSYVSVREKDIIHIESEVKKSLGRRFRKYAIAVYTDHHLLKELIPNLFRNAIPLDSSRISGYISNRIPVVINLSKGKPSAGLYNNNIALWDSHGWYYDSKSDRWKWQRARLFGTVEDKLTMSYVLPYLVPMLENSGANLFLPRERDWQQNEVVVDNDRSTEGSEFIIPKGIQFDRVSSGYLLKDTLFSGHNPFIAGTSLRLKSGREDQLIEYLPSFTTKGKYSVSVSYLQNDANSTGVKYSVYHTGGRTDFLVNQRIGGGTWIYLGTFEFDAGKNRETGKVTVSCNGDHSGFISVDAVKFGGGMGSVARRPSGEINPNKNNPELFKYKLSGKPRYLEGARYYLQSAGFPDTLVYNLNKEKNDYNDDYQSRGEWVNYLIGNPNGPNNHRNIAGMKIPVDLAFAFHTDAGITPNDSIIGTLGIYSTITDHGSFPNGKSRMSDRDLSDIVQSQIVDDIRKLYHPRWTRRGLWDKQYSEAWRPNVPSMLLELLSHQNIADMRLGLDPRFRFAVCRAIYKGILRYQSFQEHRPYTVQPLPVDHFVITNLAGDSVKLSWRPQNDPLEPTAVPLRYKVYQRLDDNGFNDGIEVSDTTNTLKLDQKDHIYSFKITALNDGGESFPGEVLSVGLKRNSKGNILVVNAFDRVCAPEIFDDGKHAGIAWWKDQGVPDHQDLSFVGFQYDFDRNSNWLDDDSPGWGASYGDMEGKLIPGNNFDNPIVHGKAIMAAGYSFVSTSDEVFCMKKFDGSPYFATDIILGEERSTPGLTDSLSVEFKIYTPEFRSKISEIAKTGGRIFLSGAYIGSEIGENKDSIVAGFAKDILHFAWRTGHASKGGAVYATDHADKWFHGKWNFNTIYDPEIYTVEAPDGIEPVGKNAITAFRYGENSVSAGVVFNGKYKVVSLGFPFETIIDNGERDLLMQQIIRFFESK